MATAAGLVGAGGWDLDYCFGDGTFFDLHVGLWILDIFACLMVDSSL